jgi:hypothetical protein
MLEAEAFCRATVDATSRIPESFALSSGSFALLRMTVCGLLGREARSVTSSE